MDNSTADGSEQGFLGSSDEVLPVVGFRNEVGTIRSADLDVEDRLLVVGTFDAFPHQLV